MEQLNFLDYLLDQNNIEMKQLSETERLDQSVQPLLEWFEVFARTSGFSHVDCVMDRYHRHGTASFTELRLYALCGHL